MISTGSTSIQTNSYGFQLAGLQNVASNHYGIQVAGLSNVVQGDNNGIQIAGVFNIAHNNSGVQMSLAMNDAQKQSILQIALVNGAYSLSGGQIGFANRIEGGMKGIQIGVINSAVEVGAAVATTTERHGLQVGIINGVEDFHGLQIGVINVCTTRLKGVQIGIANFAPRGSISPFMLGINMGF